MSPSSPSAMMLAVVKALAGRADLMDTLSPVMLAAGG